MHGGNPARTGVMTGSGPSFDAPVAVKWKWSSGGLGQWTAPIVYSGMLYHSPGTLSGLYAFEFETGAERWHALDGRDLLYQIAAENRIYAVADYHFLVALDAASGQELWSTRVDGIHARSMVVVDGSLFCRTDYGGIVALNASDGVERWYFEERAMDDSLIAVDGGTLFFGSITGALIAIDTETGTERWRLSIPPGNPPSSSAIIVADGTLYLRDYQGSLVAIDPDTGVELWRTPAGALDALSAVHHGRVYGSNSALGACALDATTGELLWSFSTILFMEISGVFGDTVLALGSAGTREMWRVHGLDAATGAERWSFECPPRMYNPTVIGNHLLVSGIMGYVLGNVLLPTLSQDVVLRGAPAPTGIQRGTATAGTEISTVGERAESGGEVWVRVTIGDMSGWIPLAAIDPATLAPEGEVEYVYEP